MSKRRTGDGSAAAAASGIAPQGLVSAPSGGVADLHEADMAMQYLMLRDDGWLRMVPHDYGKTSYWKWKFTQGPWSGHYVMWVADAADWTGAVVGLVTKIMLVDRGELRPALDRPYDS